jgi:hypothetical protein
MRSVRRITAPFTHRHTCHLQVLNNRDSKCSVCYSYCSWEGKQHEGILIRAVFLHIATSDSKDVPADAPFGMQDILRSVIRQASVGEVGTFDECQSRVTTQEHFSSGMREK